MSDRKTDILTLWPFLGQIIDKALELLSTELQTIYLFGSRARGDCREHSDFDLGFKFVSKTPESWAKFWCWVDEDLQSLHKFDLVDLSTANAELTLACKKEGVVLYDKT